MREQDNANGTRATYLYDALQRTMQVRHSTQANVEIDHAYYSYDAVSRPVSKHTSAGLVSYGYDIRDFLVSEGIPGSGTGTTLAFVPNADAVVSDGGKIPITAK